MGEFAHFGAILGNVLLYFIDAFVYSRTLCLTYLGVVLKTAALREARNVWGGG